jgi:hypothetical protein
MNCSGSCILIFAKNVCPSAITVVYCRTSRYLEAPMSKFWVTVVFLFMCSALIAGNKPNNDGNWWQGMLPGFKLGWVTGYTKAMETAGAFQMVECGNTLPLYSQKYPDVPAKELFERLCLKSNETYDYDGITMGQFVDGIDAFYKDFRNRPVEAEQAIEYVRDQARGKPAQELESKLTLWRRCAAASQTGDIEQIKKACIADTTPAK